jgi:CRISPR-associated protein Cas6
MSTTHVDLAFPVRGTTVPRDHAYALYGALSRAQPDLHGQAWLGVHSIPGRLKDGDLDLSTGSYLRLRIPTERIAALLPLAGATLEVHGRPVTLGAPTIHALRPVAALDAHLVVIRLTNGVKRPFDKDEFNQRFAAEAQRQLDRLGVKGEFALRGRRSITVGGQRIMGHAVGVTGLTAEHSLLLQIHGLGGKRSMGCGLFRPAKLKLAIAAPESLAS